MFFLFLFLFFLTVLLCCGHCFLCTGLQSTTETHASEHVVLVKLAVMVSPGSQTGEPLLCRWLTYILPTVFVGFCWLVAKLFLTFAISWSITHQASLSLGLSRQENWRWLSFPLRGDLPDPQIEPISPASSALTDSLPLSHLGRSMKLYI